jgi:hypothetical protein
VKELTRTLPPESTLCGCRTCGLVFSGLGPFDDHRKQGPGKERACRRPPEVGLMRNKHGVWRYPLPEDKRPAHWKKEE